MGDSLPITARVPASVAARLKALAAAEDRSVSYLVGEALERYLDDEEWQVAEIQAAIVEADAEDDASMMTQEEAEASLRGYLKSLKTPSRRKRGDHDSAA